MATPLRILLTGADGQLGHDIVDHAAAQGHDVIGLSRAELDIVDDGRVDHVIRGWSPDGVVHCAAWTDVDGAESNRSGAFAVNDQGTRHVARASAACGAQLVVVSTDYVFAGDNPDGYAEDDPVSPVNAYGESKLAGELAASDEHPAPCIARTAWLFGAHGNNFVRTIARLAAERDTIDVVTDQTGSPTWTRHLAAALVAALERKLTGVLHLGGHPDATWFDVAREVIAASGSECELRPTTSDAFSRPAKRPACSILRSTRPDAPAMGDWREGVRALLTPVGATQATRRTDRRSRSDS